MRGKDEQLDEIYMVLALLIDDNNQIKSIVQQAGMELYNSIPLMHFSIILHGSYAG